MKIELKIGISVQLKSTNIYALYYILVAIFYKACTLPAYRCVNQDQYSRYHPFNISNTDQEIYHHTLVNTQHQLSFSTTVVQI